jgi:hypothetical protein
MKLSSLSQRDRRALLLGGVILVPSLLFVFVIKPYMNALANVREQTEQEQDFLNRERELAKRLPTLPQEKTEASQRLRQEAARLFTGEDDLVATGNLADYVAMIADQNGVQLQQSETRNALPVAPGVRALQVEVRADGDVYGILHFMQQLETGDKLVRLGRLSIERGRSGVLDTSRVRGNDILTLSASVYGYRLDGVAYSGSDSTLNGAPSPFERASIDLPSINAVINRNPFDPLRQPPRATQLASGWGASEEEPVLRLMGTVINPNGESFAVCNVGKPTGQLVRIGETINGYTLRSVMPKRAVFTTPSGAQVTLETPPPGAFASSGAGRRDWGGRNRGPGADSAKSAEAARQIAEAQAAAHAEGDAAANGEKRTINVGGQTIELPPGSLENMTPEQSRALRQRIMDAMEAMRRNGGGFTIDTAGGVRRFRMRRPTQ